MDNGPEFIRGALNEWAHRNGMALTFICPGAPTDNACFQAFNARLRRECLNENWFLSPADAAENLECHRKEYNSFCPHSLLGDLTLEEFHRPLASGFSSEPQRRLALLLVQNAGADQSIFLAHFVVLIYGTIIENTRFICRGEIGTFRKKKSDK